MAMMIQLMEMGLQPKTVLALRHYYSCICLYYAYFGMLIPSTYTCPSRTRTREVFSLSLLSFDIPRTPKDMIYPMAMRSVFWCGARWGWMPLYPKMDPSSCRAEAVLPGCSVPKRMWMSFPDSSGTGSLLSPGLQPAPSL